MQPLVILYIATAVVSIIIAVVLVRIAMLTSTAKIATQKKEVDDVQTPVVNTTYDNDIWEKGVLDEVKKISGSPLKSQKVAKKILKDNEKLQKYLNK